MQNHFLYVHRMTDSPAICILTALVTSWEGLCKTFGKATSGPPRYASACRICKAGRGIVSYTPI